MLMKATRDVTPPTLLGGGPFTVLKVEMLSDSKNFPRTDAE